MNPINPSFVGACLLSVMAVSAVAAPDSKLKKDQERLNHQVIDKPFSVDETDDKYHEHDYERRYKKRHRERHEDWDDATR